MRVSLSRFYYNINWVVSGRIHTSSKHFTPHWCHWCRKISTLALKCLVSQYTPRTLPRSNDICILQIQCQNCFKSTIPISEDDWIYRILKRNNQLNVKVHCSRKTFLSQRKSTNMYFSISIILAVKRHGAFWTESCQTLKICRKKRSSEMMDDLTNWGPYWHII